MQKSCVYIPEGKHEAELFLRLKDNFGRKTAAEIYNRVITSDFIDRFRDSLTLVEGVPTYQSVVNNPLVKDYLGERLLQSLNMEQPHLTDTVDNVNILMDKANVFNNENNDYIAYVDYDEDKNLTLHVVNRDEASLEIAENQRKIHELNKRIADMLSGAGITIGHLSDIERAVGRVGVTNFNHLANVVGNFSDLIKIANNMEGYKALSEEFAHTLVGINRSRTLVTRSINMLKDEAVAREVLGNEYDKVSTFYNGNAEAIAEEALGKILRDTFLSNAPKTKNSLFKRAINFIVNLFKGYNPAYVNDTIDYVKNNMSKLSEKYMDGRKKITRKDIVQSEREIEFNALSELGKVQMDKLKKMFDDACKRANLVVDERLEKDKNLKRSAYIFKSKVEDIVDKAMKNEATIVGIYEYLNLAIADLRKYYSQLSHIKDSSKKEQGELLRNVQFTIQQFEQGVHELRNVLTDKFLQDEHISDQIAVFSDDKNDLTSFETLEEEKKIKAPNIKELINNIVYESSLWSLSKDASFYKHRKTGQKGKRVTSVIQVPGEKFDNSNPWHLPSTNAGTGIDEMVRDFLAGEIIEDKDNKGHYTIRGEELDKVYPNADKESLNTFAEALHEFKSKKEAEGLHFIPRDVTVSGVVKTLDNNGETHNIKVVGTVDILCYDDEDNWYLYDIKTHLSDIDGAKKEKYTKQLSLYKKLLEDKYGINIKETGILPVSVSYPKPKGAGGDADYSLNPRKSAKYKGAYSNQLKVNGEDFRGLNPELESLDIVNAKELNIRFEDLLNTPVDGVATIMTAVENADKQLSELRTLYDEEVKKHVSKLFAEVLGDKILVQDTDDEGNPLKELKSITVEELLESAPLDNSIMQRFLVSYANNPDPFIQAMDYIVKFAKAKKRDKVIEAAQKIVALGIKYEKLGVKNYSFMFEEDKQNYINHIEIDGVDYSYDGAAYKKAKQEFIDSLSEKYGEHPIVGTEEYKQKIKERDAWIDENTTEVELDGGKKIIPLHSKYPSKYANLTQAQKDFYDEWMEMKEELDVYIGDKTWLTNTIKIRKSNFERLTNLTEEKALNKFLESTRASFMKSYDDDVNYIQAMKDFEGNKVNKLPLLYLHAQDASDVTTDVISSLIAYADMVYNYDCMNEVVDSLELARNVAKERSKLIPITIGGRIVKEKYGNPLYAGNASVFLDIVEDLMESKVYGKYQIDQGTFGDTNIDKQKSAGLLLRIGSMYQLGFNEIAHIANLITGKAMQRIDAIAGEHFTMRQLHKADATILADLPQIVLDQAGRVKKSKVSLMAEYFNFKQDFNGNIKHSNFVNRMLLTRVFGPHIQFLGHNAGDFVLYSRSGIAILQSTMILDVEGNEISIWDAASEVPIDPSNPDAGNKLVWQEGLRTLEGKSLTRKELFDVEEEIHQINQHDFGIYNDEDSLAARRYILGRFGLQYRDFIPAQFQYRFAKRSQHLTKGKDKEFEGYYRTYYRFLKEVATELKAGEFRMGQIKESMEPWEWKNVVRARVETAQVLMLYLVGLAIKGLKNREPEKQPKWYKMLLSYASMFTERFKTEWGSLAPALPITMGKELLNIAKSPAAATSPAEDIFNLRKLFNPLNYTDEIERGRYKGHSTAYKTFWESPAALWHRTIVRQLDPEQKEKFYKQ